MGGSESKNSSNGITSDPKIQSKIIPFQKFEATHSHFKTYEDGRYGKIALYTKNSDQSKLYLLKEKWCSNDVAKTQMRAVLKDICKEESEYVQDIAYLGEEEQNTFCSEFSRFFIIFPFSPWTLKRKITVWSKKTTSDGKRRKVKNKISKINSLVHERIRNLAHS